VQGRGVRIGMEERSEEVRLSRLRRVDFSSVTELNVASLSFVECCAVGSTKFIVLNLSSRPSPCCGYCNDTICSVTSPR
jgi:hypothetical protein